jgi:DNA replication ATP-dependent helicase Dna2
MGALIMRGVQTGDLVKDWRRMNVAFTRARAKLVIFGSRKTLARTPLLESFFELMKGEDWIIRLPHGAHEAHAEVFHPTQDVLTAGRRKHEDCMENVEPEKRVKEPCSIGAGGSKRRRISPDVGILRGRPILRDIFNDVIDLT